MCKPHILSQAGPRMRMGACNNSKMSLGSLGSLRWRRVTRDAGLAARFGVGSCCLWKKQHQRGTYE